MRQIDLSTMTDDALRTLAAEIEAELQRRSQAAPAESGEVWTIQDGCVDQAAIKYDPHHRARNWMATVSRNRTAPGGLDRSFWDRGSGTWCKLPASLEVGQVIEVAADYTKASGRREYNREYYRVTAIEADRLVVERCESPAA